MRKTSVAVIVGLILAPFGVIQPVSAQSSTACNTGGVTAFTKETLTVSTSALPLTASVYNPTGGPRATVALIAVNANNIRVWFDGSAPTDTAGIIVAAGAAPFYVCGADIPKVQMIRDDASDAEVAVQYFFNPNIN
jgi:hypothetical protein